MLDAFLSVVLQVLAFSLIPFVVYLIQHKTVKGFWEYIGLKQSNAKANGLALLVLGLFALPVLLLALFHEDFLAIMTDPKSVTGQFRQMGFSFSSLCLLVLMAVFKTAFAEEILFRGFIAKRLIAWLGFQTGNILQAVLFGLIHLLLFMTISTNAFFLFFIMTFPTLGAYASAYLNEKVAGGSIIPGWIAHAGANLFSYILIGFIL